MGYYQRAKNLHQASKIIFNHHQVQIPQNYEELIRLPGFGPYTTAAVLSFAFNKPYPVLDANVRRLLMRLRRLAGEADFRNDRILLKHLEPFLTRRNSSLFNQALMELGSLVCRARNPLCLLCPIREHCGAYKRGEQEIIPQPRKRDFKKIEAVVGILRKNGRYLIQKRPASGLLAGLWEFPGGKRMPGETLKEALRREIKEELGIEVKKEKFLIKVHHAYTQFRVTLYAYECSLRQEPKFKKNAHRWVSLRNLRQYPFPSGSAKIVNYLEQRDKTRK